MSAPLPVRGALMRGGTSRGLVLALEDVPPAGPERDACLVALIGSNDPGQIDGVGGNSSVTSKVMLISHERRDQSEIPYLFAQVHPRQAIVDYGGNCGNMTAAVALYAVDAGLTPLTDPLTRVPLFNLNTSTRVEAMVPTSGPAASTRGDYRIPGVSAPGPEIVTRYLEPAGTTGALPTGRPSQTLDVPGLGAVTVSIVDITSPLVFVRADELGLTGIESPDDINADERLLRVLERIRGLAALELGLVDDPEDAARISPGIPKIAMVASPTSYDALGGMRIDAHDVDLVARVMSVQRAHPSFSLTGVMCTAAASLIPGTIPADASSGRGGTTVRIGHPMGVAVARATLRRADDAVAVASVEVSRTARVIIRGPIEPVRTAPATRLG